MLITYRTTALGMHTREIALIYWNVFSETVFIKFTLSQIINQCARLFDEDERKTKFRRINEKRTSEINNKVKIMHFKSSKISYVHMSKSSIYWKCMRSNYSHKRFIVWLNQVHKFNSNIFPLFSMSVSRNPRRTHHITMICGVLCWWHCVVGVHVTAMTHKYITILSCKQQTHKNLCNLPSNS